MYSQLQVLQLLFFFIGKRGKKVKIKKYSSNINEAKFLITVDVQFQEKEKFHCVILAFDAWKLSSFHTAQLMLLLLDTGRIRNVSWSGWFLQMVSWKIGIMSAFDFIPELFLGGPHLSLLSLS